jgi:hypothetical protein
MNDALLEETLGLNDILLHARVLDEFLPYLVGREWPSKMKELGDPEVRALSHEFLRDNFYRLIHFVIYYYYNKQISS